MATVSSVMAAALLGAKDPSLMQDVLELFQKAPRAPQDAHSTSYSAGCLHRCGCVLSQPRRIHVCIELECQSGRRQCLAVAGCRCPDWFSLSRCGQSISGLFCRTSLILFFEGGERTDGPRGVAQASSRGGGWPPRHLRPPPPPLGVTATTAGADRKLLEQLALAVGRTPEEVLGPAMFLREDTPMWGV